MGAHAREIEPFRGKPEPAAGHRCENLGAGGKEPALGRVLLAFSISGVIAVGGVRASLTSQPATPPPALQVSTRTTGGPFLHIVGRGDSLASLGARFGIEPREIADTNGLKVSAALTPGSTLRLDNRHVVPAGGDNEALGINVPQRMLFLSTAESLIGVPVALGRRDWPTPLGAFTVQTKEENPTWDVPSSIQAEMRREGRPVVTKVEPGPQNPLGAHWLGLSLGSIGVHGTNAPLSIYRHTTHGCVRLHPDDIAALYPLVPVGLRGRILYEPVLLARTAEGIFLEAHADVYRRVSGSPMLAVRDAAAAAGLVDAIDWTQAARVLQGRAGIARSVERATW